MYLAMDKNGNKVLRVTRNDVEKMGGFSVQTNGNLLKTHNLNVELRAPLTGNDQAIAVAELVAFAAELGEHSTLYRKVKRAGLIGGAA